MLKFGICSHSRYGQIHFVIEQENTGLWHTYLIAIDEKDYDKYKDIIDYTYERTDQVPNAVQVYGYPVIIDEELKTFLRKRNGSKFKDVNLIMSENDRKKYFSEIL